MSFFVPQFFRSFSNSTFIPSRLYPSSSSSSNNNPSFISSTYYPSSSSSSSSSSSRKKQRHEIFISFRGETRNSFISHLQKALKNKEAITFSDKASLLNGQTIAYELQKAIKKASIALVVFSKDYASSTWCLDELVKIVECKKNGSLIVIPIFYDVDPSDVRKQKNSFAKSFEEHEADERFKNLPEKILNWKNALKEVTALVGVDIRGQDEALCVNKIVNDVLSRLPCAEDLLGMKSRIRKLKMELNSQTHNNELISWLGIYGEAGIGKTATATALFPHIKGEFDNSCFLVDAKEIKENMNNFRKHALSTIAKLEQGIYDENGSDMVVVVDETHHQKLMSKRFLLVVDDVEESEQVDELVAESKWFGVGSKIIITTKNQDLLNRFHRVHKIDLLSDNESRQLFNKHAFKYCNTQTHHHEHCLTHSLRVADYAIGHPLLLKVLGSHFCYLQKEKRLDDLMNSLERLEKIWFASKKNSIENIISKLEISLNGLSDSQKKMLIDLACLLTREKNTSEDDLNPMDYYSEEFDVLIEKSLIHVNNEGQVGMHHLIREMCSTIEQRRIHNEYRRHKQLWGKEDSFKEKKEIIEEQTPTNVVRKKETVEERPPTDVVIKEVIIEEQPPNNVADWKPESQEKYGDIEEHVKFVDSLKIDETKSQGQGSKLKQQGSKAMACNAPAQKPSTYRPPQAKAAAAIQAEILKMKVDSSIFLNIGYREVLDMDCPASLEEGLESAEKIILAESKKAFDRMVIGVEDGLEAGFDMIDEIVSDVTEWLWDD